jgi:predicted GH43/DUF377 family glycosyl hydrolase
MPAAINKNKGRVALMYQDLKNLDEFHYKIGETLFDVEDPTKVLSRRYVPILETEAPYVLNGKINA